MAPPPATAVVPSPRRPRTPVPPGHPLSAGWRPRWRRSSSEPGEPPPQSPRPSLAGGEGWGWDAQVSGRRGGFGGGVRYLRDRAARQQLSLELQSSARPAPGPGGRRGSERYGATRARSHGHRDRGEGAHLARVGVLHRVHVENLLHRAREHHVRLLLPPLQRALRARPVGAGRQQEQQQQRGRAARPRAGHGAAEGGERRPGKRALRTGLAGTQLPGGGGAGRAGGGTRADPAPRSPRTPPPGPVAPARPAPADPRRPRTKRGDPRRGRPAQEARLEWR